MPAPWRRLGRLLGALPVAAERDRDLVRLLEGLILRAGRATALPGPLSERSQAGKLGQPGSAGAGLNVAFFCGCANSALLGAASRRLMQLLQAAGCRLIVPEDQVCCGALARHTGRAGRADQLRAHNSAVFLLQGKRPDVIVVEAAGCGLELQSYPPELAARIRDACVLLDSLTLPESRPVHLQVAIHDPCHARHGQGISDEPRRLLAGIPGLILLEPDEQQVCCGSGGAYSLQHPGLSEAMGRRKAQLLADTGADLVVTSNPGCLGQIADGLALVAPQLPVILLTDLLWYAHMTWEP
jgi:glycolate oxidase iron-sulfur subunit